MKQNRTDKRSLLAGIAAAAFVAILLAPTFHLGFIADDAPNSALTQTALASSGRTLWSYMVGDFANWMRAGRFFPLSHYIRPLFWAIDGSLVAYRAIIAFLVAANLALFAIFVRRLSGSKGLALLGAIIVPALFQIRYYHDPIMSFAGLLQVTLGLTLLSLLLLMMWLDEKRPYQLVLSVVFYAMSLLVYEIGLPFFLLHAFLIWRCDTERSLRDVLRLSWPFAAVAVVDALIPIAFRLSGGVALSGGASAGTWTPHLAPAAILITFAKQTLGALPLSYYAARVVGTRLGLTNGLFFGTPVQYAALFPLASLSLVALAVFVGMTGARTARSELADAGGTSDVGRGRGVFLAGLGFGLWLLPGALISLSPVRQAELFWGASYLPVYLSYFGLALMALAALRWLFARWPERSVAIGITVGLAAGLLGMVWYGNAVTAIELLNREWLYPRTLAENAVRSGLLADVGGSATILTSDARFWDNPDFYANLDVARPANVIRIAEKSATATAFAAEVNRTSRDASPTYYLDYGARSDGSGYAILARVTTLTPEPDGGFRLEGAPVAYFVAAPTGQSATSRKVSPLLPAETPLPDAAALGLPAVADESASGPRGTLARYAPGHVFVGRWAPATHWH